LSSQAYIVSTYVDIISRPTRLNGRAYATVLRPSVVVCDVMYCG